MEPAFGPQRFNIASVIVAIALCVLVGRLYYLQIVEGERYRQKSQSNFVQARRVAHARGLIYDQQGRPLVDNRPSHDVHMTVAFLPDSEHSLKLLTAPLQLDDDALTAFDRQILKAIDDPDAGPIVLAENAPAPICRDVDGRIRKYELTGASVRWHSPSDEDGCRISVLASEFPSRSAVFERLRRLVGMTEEEMRPLMLKALKKSRGLGRFKPAPLLEDVDFKAYARLRTAISLGELPGLSLVESMRRRYLEEQTAAHVLGFMNEMTPREYKDLRDEGYRLGDRIGRRGIEQTFEPNLRGEDGVLRVVVDAKGRDQGDSVARALLADARRVAPKPGNSLVLSLDYHMQKAAEEGFRGRAGSVVAVDPRTGFVLAMASFPAYDPNFVTGPGSGDFKRSLDKNEYKPWTNKALQDHYAPGSTFKAITAVAALRAELIDEKSIRMCPGYFRLKGATWRCYNRGGHGGVALVRALQYSCDTYFYSLGYEMGPDKHAESARLLGFGTRTGIGIDREIPGIMPDRQYYVDRVGYYAPGFVVNNSIGQGDVAVTPLQLAMAYAAIGNGGTLYRPQVVRQIVDVNGEVVEDKQPVVRFELGADSHHLEMVREALSHVTEPGGTAAGLLWRRDQPEVSKWVRESAQAGIRIGGKTGTAQVVRLAKNIAHVRPEDVEYYQRDHAWFVGMAPALNPEIVVVTMTEHGGFGGSTSAPVVARVIKAYYDHVRGTGFYASLLDGEEVDLSHEEDLP